MKRLNIAPQALLMAAAFAAGVPALSVSPARADCSQASQIDIGTHCLTWNENGNSPPSGQPLGEIINNTVRTLEMTGAGLTPAQQQEVNQDIMLERDNIETTARQVLGQPEPPNLGSRVDWRTLGIGSGGNGGGSGTTGQRMATNRGAPSSSRPTTVSTTHAATASPLHVNPAHIIPPRLPVTVSPTKVATAAPAPHPVIPVAVVPPPKPVTPVTLPTTVSTSPGRSR